MLGVWWQTLQQRALECCSTLCDWVTEGQVTRHRIYKLKLEGRPGLVDALKQKASDGKPYVPETMSRLADARDLRRALRTAFRGDVELKILSVKMPTVERL